jgi:hypothetical protein
MIRESPGAGLAGCLPAALEQPAAIELPRLIITRIFNTSTATLRAAFVTGNEGDFSIKFRSCLSSYTRFDRLPFIQIKYTQYLKRRERQL